MDDLIAKGYTPLWYIESDGTQYIDTGFKPNQDTRVVVDVRLKQLDNATNSGSPFIFGTQSSSSAKCDAYWYRGVEKFGTYYGNAEHQFDNVVDGLERVTIDWNKNNHSLNGEAYTYTSKEFSCGYNLILFGCNYMGTPGYFALMRLYSCQIYDNGTLIRDYIPCQTDKGIYGLWDNVNKEFVAEVKQEAVAPTYTWSTVEGSTSSSAYSSAVDGVRRIISGNGHSSASRARCTFKGVTSITFNCMYSGESYYDYLTIGNLDSTCTRDNHGTSLQATSGTAKDITFNCTEDEHYVEFCYSKDASVTEGDDCGYVYIKSVVAVTAAASSPFTGKWSENKEMKVSVQEFRHRLMAAFGANVFIPDYAAIDEYGVAIMDIRGKFYKDAASWQAAGSPTVNGVAVSDGVHRFCIAKDIIENVCNGDGRGADAEYWGAYGTTVRGVTTTTVIDTANADFNGIANTDAIVANVTSSDGYFTKAPWSAAGLCRQFTFPNGAAGYLGACGEWSLVNDVKHTVNTLLVAIGGTQLQLTNSGTNFSYYWASTQYDINSAWRWNFSKDDCSQNNKGNSLQRVRAFCTI